MSSTPPSADIFTRISDPAEKTRHFLDLVKSRGEIVAKRPEPSADVFLLLAQNYTNEKLICKISSTVGFFKPQGSLILTFFIGGEKYFFQTNYEVVGDQITLFCENPLFHLQRRLDYRIRIPGGYQALFEIVALNGVTHKRSILLQDLSGGGCRIKVDPKVLFLKTQDELKGHLYLPDRNPIGVTGSVRHIRVEGYGEGPLICGIQFIGLTEPIKNKIIAVVMDLYRELFAGRS